VLRILRGLPDLRTPRMLRHLERCFRAGKEKRGFALLHYSIQRDHLHLLVEVKNRRTLARGLQGLAIRIAKCVNRRWHRARGQVFAERYFALALKTLRQIWRTTRYVLNNGRKHGAWMKKDEPDPYSSGAWFRGWSTPARRPSRSPPVVFWSLDLWPRLDFNDIPGPRWHESPELEPVFLL
jgi:REP element-mobilizing transposase RayT